MDNKQNRQFYWEVKQFLNTSPVPFAPKAASLKDSIGSVLKENSPYKQNNFVKDSGSVNTAKTTLGNHRKVELANLPSCAAYTKNGNTNPFNITEGLLEYTQPNSNNMSTDEKTRLADRMNRAVTNPVYGAVTAAFENPVAGYMRDVQSGPVGQAINQGLGSAIKTTVDAAGSLLDNKYTRAFHDAVDSGLQAIGLMKPDEDNTQTPNANPAPTQQPTSAKPTSAAPIQPARREPTVRQQPTGTQPTPQQSAPQPGLNAAPARNPSQPYRPQYTSNQGPQSGPQSTGSGIRVGNRQMSSSEFYGNKQTGSIMDRLANMDVTKSPGGYAGLPAAGNFNTGPAITLPRMKNKSISESVLVGNTETTPKVPGRKGYTAPVEQPQAKDPLFTAYHENMAFIENARNEREKNKPFTTAANPKFKTEAEKVAYDTGSELVRAIQNKKDFSPQEFETIASRAREANQAMNDERRISSVYPTTFADFKSRSGGRSYNPLSREDQKMFFDATASKELNVPATTGVGQGPSYNSLEYYTMRKSAKADIPQNLDNLHNLNTMSSSSNIHQLSGNNAQRGQIVQGMIDNLMKGTKTKSEFRYSSGRTV
jgi:hypothetical protein